MASRYYTHQARQRITGGRFDYFGVSSVKLAVIGQDDIVRIKISNESRRQIVSTSAALFCDLEVSGPGGLHPDFAEAINTPYVIYAAWKSGTYEHNGDLILFAVPSGTVVNAALVALLDPAVVYDYWTLPIGMMCNDAAGDIRGFYQRGSWFWFHDMNWGAAALTAGTAVGSTPVPLAFVVPEEAVRIGFFANFQNTNNVSNTCTLLLDDGVVEYRLYAAANISSLAGDCQRKELHALIPLFDTPDAAVNYFWSGAVVGGLFFYVQGVELYEGE